MPRLHLPTPRTVLVPARGAEGEALIRTAELDDTQIAPMPLAATPRHLATLMKALIGRPLRLGQQRPLQRLFVGTAKHLRDLWRVAAAPFCPLQMSAGRMIDLSASTPAQRLDYLAAHACRCAR